MHPRSAVNSANASRQGRSSFWTAARVTVLRELWEADEWAADIADAIGDGCTRLMVIGKANRLKLTPKSEWVGHGAERRTAPMIRVPCETSEAA